jgi:hypothetical protein
MRVKSHKFQYQKYLFYWTKETEELSKRYWVCSSQHPIPNHCEVLLIFLKPLENALPKGVKT